MWKTPEQKRKGSLCVCSVDQWQKALTWETGDLGGGAQFLWQQASWGTTVNQSMKEISGEWMTKGWRQTDERGEMKREGWNLFRFDLLTVWETLRQSREKSNGEGRFKRPQWVKAHRCGSGKYYYSCTHFFINYIQEGLEFNKQYFLCTDWNNSILQGIKKCSVTRYLF